MKRGRRSNRRRFRCARAATLRPGACHHLPCLGARCARSADQKKKPLTRPGAPGAAPGVASPSPCGLRGANSADLGEEVSAVSSVCLSLGLSAPTGEQHCSRRRGASCLSCCCYRRVYCPFKSPRNASGNFLKVSISARP